MEVTSQDYIQSFATTKRMLKRLALSVIFLIAVVSAASDTANKDAHETAEWDYDMVHVAPKTPVLLSALLPQITKLSEDWVEVDPEPKKNKKSTAMRSSVPGGYANGLPKMQTTTAKGQVSLQEDQPDGRAAVLSTLGSPIPETDQAKKENGSKIGTMGPAARASSDHSQSASKDKKPQPPPGKKPQRTKRDSNKPRPPPPTGPAPADQPKKKCRSVPSDCVTTNAPRKAQAAVPISSLSSATERVDIAKDWGIEVKGGRGQVAGKYKRISTDWSYTSNYPKVNQDRDTTTTLPWYWVTGAKGRTIMYYAKSNERKHGGWTIANKNGQIRYAAACKSQCTKCQGTCPRCGKQSPCDRHLRELHHAKHECSLCKGSGTIEGTPERDLTKCIWADGITIKRAIDAPKV